MLHWLYTFLLGPRYCERRFPCPACGFITLSEGGGGTYEICSLCFWEDDSVQLDDPCHCGGANGPSLLEWQREVVLPQCPESVLRFRGFDRAEGWRPICDADLVHWQKNLLKHGDEVPDGMITRYQYWHWKTEE
ncbi:hypothetical protein KDL29_07015 [bacterium]|nr:hypothetical protein [bacterium]